MVSVFVSHEVEWIFVRNTGYVTVTCSISKSNDVRENVWNIFNFMNIIFTFRKLIFFTTFPSETHLIISWITNFTQGVPQKLNFKVWKSNFKLLPLNYDSIRSFLWSCAPFRYHFFHKENIPFKKISDKCWIFFKPREFSIKCSKHQHKNIKII